MSKTPASAAGGALPASGLTTSRRTLLGALAAAPALAVPAVAMAAQGDDTELLSLEREILQRNDECKRIDEERILPFETDYDALLGKVVTKDSYEAAWRFSDSCGRSYAIRDQEGIFAVADKLFRRMLALPAHTQAGRAAKVRVLLVHVWRDNWRGPRSELDWEGETTRQLLGEFAGMTEEELANV